MKIKISLLVITLISLSPALLPAEPTAKSLRIDYSVGLNFNHSRVSVLVGDNNLVNTLNYSYLALELDVGISDYLILGVVAGFNSNHLKDPVDFYNLPLSLRVNEEKFNSMVLGLRAKSEFLSWKDFSFAAGGEFLYFKKYEKNLPIQLPVVSGEAIIKNSFTQIGIELWAQYDGFSYFTIFAGPQLNFLDGKLEATETIEELEGEEELSYKQENDIGIVAGARFEVGSHFDVNLKVNLISKTSLSVEVFYIF
jgi:hypothetical protein